MATEGWEGGVGHAETHQKQKQRRRKVEDKKSEVTEKKETANRLLDATQPASPVKLGGRRV